MAKKRKSAQVRKAEKVLRELAARLATPEGRVEYEKFMEESRKSIEPLLEKIREAERITAADLAVTITPCPIE